MKEATLKKKAELVDQYADKFRKQPLLLTIWV